MDDYVPPLDQIALVGFLAEGGYDKPRGSSDGVTDEEGAMLTKMDRRVEDNPELFGPITREAKRIVDVGVLGPELGYSRVGSNLLIDALRGL